MDNIREKLVELLGSLTTVQVFCDMDGDPVSRLVSRVVAEDDVDGLADHLIANNVTVQEWISVEDRLPEQFESVIGWTVFGEIGEVEYTGKRFISAYDYDVAQVTHWMPLPQPPKGE